MPQITGQDLLDVAGAKKPTAGGLDGWAWKEIKISTSWGQRTLCVLPVIHRLWASFRLTHLKDWVEGWVPQSALSLGNGVSSVEAWFSTALEKEGGLIWCWE